MPRMGGVSTSSLGECFSPLQCSFNPIFDMDLHLDQLLEISNSTCWSPHEGPRPGDIFEEAVENRNRASSVNWACGSLARQVYRPPTSGAKPLKARRGFSGIPVLRTPEQVLDSRSVPCRGLMGSRASPPHDFASMVSPCNLLSL
jgi:hypothetical protein